VCGRRREYLTWREIEGLGEDRQAVAAGGHGSQFAPSKRQGCDLGLMGAVRIRSNALTLTQHPQSSSPPRREARWMASIPVPVWPDSRVGIAGETRYGVS
jgi:hypothetical protein